MLEEMAAAASRGVVAVSLLIACAPQALAQSPPTASRAATFLPRSDFYFSWAALTTADPRFDWDTHLGVDADLIGYRAGRMNLMADYEAVLGSERRRFDLNHSNYVLEGSLSYRVSGVDAAGLFRHESRHLSDRPNPQSISWNLVGVRTRKQLRARGSTVDVQVSSRGYFGQHYVDYTWTSDLGITVRHPVSRGAVAFASATGGLIGVDASRAGRDHRQCGSRLEAGIRLPGQTGALELYVGYERRIDAYPLDRTRQRWFAFGFRLVTK